MGKLVDKIIEMVNEDLEKMLCDCKDKCVFKQYLIIESCCKCNGYDKYCREYFRINKDGK